MTGGSGPTTPSAVTSQQATIQADGCSRRRASAVSTGGGLEADWPGHRGLTHGLANRQRCWLDLKRMHGPVRALGRDVVSRWK